MSALLGRMPSAVGYQPTLLTEMGGAAGADHLDEEGVDYVDPGDLRASGRLHRPGAGDDFRASGATTNLSRQISELGIYPAVDPLASTSRILDPRIIGDEHYNVARVREADPPALQGPAGHHRHPRDRRTVRGGQAQCPAPGKSSGSSPSRSSSPSSSPVSMASTS